MGVGKSIIRLDSVEKVTGKTLYVEDIKMSNMLYAKVFRSPVAYGKIKNLDLELAKKVPGVKGIFTYKDVPGKNIIHVIYDDQIFLASDFVKYPGQPIAVIAANSEEACKEAIKKIKLEIEELEPLLDFEKSKNNSIKLYGDDNIFCKYHIDHGNMDIINDSDLISISDSYYTQHQEHAYIEPQGAVVYWEDNTLTIRGSMQAPFYVQQAVTEVLNMKKSRVRVIQQMTGGAFGGKEDVPNIVCSQAAICAYHLRQPVKIIYNREEDMQTMSKRHPARTDITLWADKTGKFVAVKGYYLENAGAFATLTPAVLYRGTIHLSGPYNIENVDVIGEAVATNTAPNGAYRGFGSPQTIFAMESIIDQMAEKLNMDPADIRQKNLLKLGDRTCTNQVLEDSVGLLEAFDKCIDESDYYNKIKEFKEYNNVSDNIKKGIGVSAVYYGVGLGDAGKHMSRAAGTAKIDGDGSVTVSVGVVDMGQGMRTVAAQMAAEFLGILEDNIVVSQVDTSRVLDSGPTVASRGTITAGWGILKALNKIKKRIHKFLEEKFNEKFEDIHYKDGKVLFGNHEESYFDVIKWATDKKLTLHAAALHIPPECSFDEHGQGDAYYTYAWGANVVETEVNTRTGEVKIIKATCAHDVGKAVNPREVKGQIMGGSLQGLGYGLMENMQVSSQGKFLTNNFSTYTIPTACDYPEWNPIIVEEKYPKGPYGAKGFAEQPLMGMAPALTNSIYNACGGRIKNIPAIPERVLESIRGKE
ncbi:MAG: xanthine dehydrogenase family protein molybdopterin-binding subunit [Candidatus Muirbacterium halophilum]|nr:xanthine dehydrogenase family protein molybdopterin-binding subunit [Candidatus Muirbacterium halophilum]MCK9474384.1 xanthine dehydrogenase family protein molybdopterin-binding subunit [Candidatus Muirbacterium halophilum]